MFDSSGKGTRLRRALFGLVPSGGVREKVIQELGPQIEFIEQKGSLGEEFFDFETKIGGVVERLSLDGLTREAYVEVAIDQPALFCMKPSTVIGNVDGVADCLSEYGVTRAEYLKAALKQPSLFTMKAATIVGHINGVLEAFKELKEDGGDYVRAAIKQPALLTMKSETVIANIDGVVEHLADNGLTRENYLKVAIKHPSLFTMRSETVAGNIERIVANFARDGLTCADYVKAAVKQPSLFLMRPETVIGHVNLITNLYRTGLLGLPELPRGPPEGSAKVLSFMLRDPRLFCLADDNLVLREIYARVTEASPSLSLVRRSRKEVEHELAKALGHDDLGDPVPKHYPEVGNDAHARNLLLRALIREGWIKGRLE
jgi:hypothetical protein